MHRDGWMATDTYPFLHSMVMCEKTVVIFSSEWLMEVTAWLTLYCRKAALATASCLSHAYTLQMPVKHPTSRSLQISLHCFDTVG